MTPDQILILDWSAAARPATGKDSIWLGTVAGAENLPTRSAAFDHLCDLLDQAIARRQSVLLGVDFALGYPTGFAKVLTGQAQAPAVWDWLAQHLQDGPDNRHNLRAVAARANAQFPGDGPFWGNNSKGDVPGLPRKKPDLPPGLAALRRTEQATQGAKSVWQLAGAGAVGAQSLTGQAMLARLLARFGDKMRVWPFQDHTAPITVAEVYPSILRAEVSAMIARTGCVVDVAQVQLLAQALSGLGALDALLQTDQPADLLRDEGWILGAGHALAMRRALPAQIQPPRLKDDCFAMPQGVDWVPVDSALARLRAALPPLTDTQDLTMDQALGRVLARDVSAQRSNPPRPNSAVDGYGFAHAATGAGVQRLPLMQGRAAAGQPFDGAVPPGAAVRILTGAILPDGVDTVVLEEDTATDGATLVFDGPIKPNANTRKAGEDVAQGAPALPAGHRLRAPDLALLSALGVAQVPTYRRLRVGVLSTGDEIIASPALSAAPHQIWDANRPMLLSLVRGWGYEAVDLGHARDDADRIAAKLDQGAARADVLLTSGGASAGDEDHVSQLLRDRGQLSSWRIALKPGRPLALANWQGRPVFGLPGNPVAALVCALIFARPALSQMSGAGWVEPQGFTVPAAFSKRKKPGRREYLRARLTAQGTAEVFASEGSGRISGLSWATGLVELPDEALDVQPGTPVRYLPYTGFGLI